MTVFSIRWRRVARHIRTCVCLRGDRLCAGTPRLRAPRSLHRSRHYGRAWHGGGAGKARRASRRRHPQAGRQCGRCRGRHRLCACRHLSARRKHRRRRLHGDSFGRAQRRCRHRLSRDRTGCDHARYFSRAGRQTRYRQVAQFRAWHRRARHGSRAGAGAGEIRLRPFHTRANPQARHRTGARRFCGRRRHGRHAVGYVPPDGTLAEFGKGVLAQRRHAAAGRRPADPGRSRRNALGDCRTGTARIL